MLQPGSGVGDVTRLQRPVVVSKLITSSQQSAKDSRKGPTCLVLALHAFDVDVEVQFAHPADDGLATLRVVAHPEGGVLPLEPGAAFTSSVMSLKPK